MTYPDDALCRQYDGELWFADVDTAITKHAVAICQECPVKAECLAEAMGRETGLRGFRWGVWGGLTAAERITLARAQRKQPKCVVCGSRYVDKSRGRAKTCSPACRRLRHNETRRQWVAGKAIPRLPSTLIADPDDPRHGTPAGYTAHGKTSVPACDDCKAAYAAYRRSLRDEGVAA